VQNKDGAGGLIGTNYIGEVAPKDGTMLAYLTSPAWRSVVDPEVYRVDFKTFEFIGLQPSNAVYYVRSDLPPGMKRDTDLMQEHGLVAAGLAADTSKDLLLRLTLDMLGLQYRYVTGYRSSNAARLAVQRGEASMHSESTPGYFAMVEPNLVKNGDVIPTWYDPGYDGKTFSAPKVMDGTNILAFPDFYRKVKGGEAVRHPVGCLSRQSRGRPGHAAGRGDAARLAAGRGRGAAHRHRPAQRRPGLRRGSVKTMQFVPHYENRRDLNTRVRNALVVAPGIKTFVAEYLKARASEGAASIALPQNPASPAPEMPVRIAEIDAVAAARPSGAAFDLDAGLAQRCSQAASSSAAIEKATWTGPLPSWGGIVRPAT